MDRHEVDGLPPLGTAVDDPVVGGEQLHGVGPVGQAGGRGVAHAVGRVVDVGQEDRASAGEPVLNEVDHRAEPLLEIGDPGPRLLAGRPVHGPFLRRRAPVVVYQVVAPGGHDHQSEHVAGLHFELAADVLDVMERRAARDRQVAVGQVGQDRAEADAPHVGELVVRVSVEPGEVGLRVGDAETVGDAVAQSQQQHLARGPRLRERRPIHLRPGRAFAHGQRGQAVLPVRNAAGNHDRARQNEQRKSRLPLHGEYLLRRCGARRRDLVCLVRSALRAVEGKTNQVPFSSPARGYSAVS